MKDASEWVGDSYDTLKKWSLPSDLLEDLIYEIQADALESALAVIDDRVTLLDASYRKQRFAYTAARLDEALRIQELLRVTYTDSHIYPEIVEALDVHDPICRCGHRSADHAPHCKMCGVIGCRQLTRYAATVGEDRE